jgi:tetratricopeptide (TPR) repeat protein
MRDSMARGRAAVRRLGVVLAFAAWLAAACAPRLAPPPTVTVPAHPDYVYPEVPAAFTRPQPILRLERGWQFLQGGDLPVAQREFAAALKIDPAFYPAEAGIGYARLAAGDAAAAEAAFGRALARDPTYVPALVGRGDAMLALDRGDEAAAAYRDALAARPDLPDVRRRLEGLSFRSQQAVLESAREAAAAGRYEEAVTAYQRAIGSSPESAFLYRELAVVERRQGDRSRALEHLRKATDLDPGDRQSWMLTGDLLADAADFAGAVAAYERAAELDPEGEVGKRLEQARRRLSLSRLPPEYALIAEEPVVTRAQLAALIGVHLSNLLDASARRAGVVLTDTRGHWAAPWILAVVRAGIMDAFPNHTFGPHAQVRRLDLARAVNRALQLVAERRPLTARGWIAARPAIADVPASHLGYPAVAAAVASGVMRLEAGRFGPAEAVTGAEAIAAVERLEGLAR